METAGGGSAYQVLPRSRVRAPGPRRLTSAVSPLVPFAGPLHPLVPQLYAHLLAGRFAAAADAAAALAALARVLGDVATQRYALDVLARTRSRTGEVAGVRDAASRLLTSLDAPADPRASEEAWRAIALAHLASCLMDEGRIGDALDILAHALAIVESGPGPSALGAAAGLLVARLLARLLLFEAAAELVGACLRSLRRLPEGEPSRLIVDHAARRCLFDVHAIWAHHLGLLGQARPADAQHARAASAALTMSRLARQGALGRRPQALAAALEAYAVERLENAAIADPKARPAMAGLIALDQDHRAADQVPATLEEVPAALDEIPATLEEVQPPFEARLALARRLARQGDRESARTLLAQARRVCAVPAAGQWAQVCDLVAAEIEDGRVSDEPATDGPVGERPHPAIQAYRIVTASALGRVWQDRQARMDDLRQRVQGRELERYVARTARELLVDPLTGLGNRRVLEAALRTGRASGAVFIDVDDFKVINDCWGHAVGDAVLRRLATVLRSCCRGEDTVLRYGGDEFLVLPAPGTPARVLGGRIMTRVREQDWTDLADGAHIRVSVGTADAEALKEALRRSDAAVLRAKRGGRDTLVLG